MDAANPPDSVIKWLEQDRYYRWCTYLYIPIQYAGLVLACWLWSSGKLSTFDDIGLALTMAMVSGIAINTAHELGHKRASNERWLSKVALAQIGLRALLHRAQPRPPRARRHPRGPRQLAAGRELLGVPAAHRQRQSAVGLGARVRAPATGWASRHWSPRNDILNAWAMTVVLFGALTALFGLVVLPYLLIQAVLGFSLLEVVNYLEHYGLLREQARGRALRAHRARAQLEQQQRRLERAALPPATPLRPPRQPDAPLPGAAPLRRGAAAANGLRGDDRARRRSPAVAPRDGPAAARPLRRRGDAREHPPAHAPARARALRPAAARRERRDGDTGGRRAMSAWRCPGCGYTYDEAAGHPREGFPAGTPWSEVPDDWACPDCGVRDKVDFEPVAAGGTDTDHDGNGRAHHHHHRRRRQAPLRRKRRDHGSRRRATLPSAPPTPRQHASCCAKHCSTARATSSNDAAGRRSRWATSPPPRA